MSSFMKQSLRKSNIQSDRKVKMHVKEFYKKLGQIDELVKYLKTLETKITEDNVNNVVSELIGRDLDNMEKFLILGKLNNETQDNI